MIMFLIRVFLLIFFIIILLKELLYREFTYHKKLKINDTINLSGYRALLKATAP